MIVLFDDLVDELLFASPQPDLFQKNTDDNKADDADQNEKSDPPRPTGQQGETENNDESQ